MAVLGTVLYPENHYQKSDWILTRLLQDVLNVEIKKAKQSMLHKQTKIIEHLVFQNYYY